MYRAAGNTNGRPQNAAPVSRGCRAVRRGGQGKGSIRHRAPPPRCRGHERQLRLHDAPKISTMILAPAALCVSGVNVAQPQPHVMTGERNVARRATRPLPSEHRCAQRSISRNLNAAHCHTRCAADITKNIRAAP